MRINKPWTESSLNQCTPQHSQKKTQAEHALRGKTKLIKCVLYVTSRELKISPKVFYKKAILENFAKFTGKHLCWSLVLISRTPQLY